MFICGYHFRALIRSNLKMLLIRAVWTPLLFAADDILLTWLRVYGYQSIGRKRRKFA